MKNALTIIFSFLLVCSCTEDFEELNTNPNDPVFASENLLLPSVIFDLSQTMVNETSDFGNVIGQYASRYQFNEVDLYAWQPDDRFWTPMYLILQDVADIEALAIQNGNPNYEAVALILKAYIFSIITDAYGDVPMSQANQAEEGINSPAYDTQEEIYDSILFWLREANAMIDESNSIDGDILYQGHMHNWKKFANSLRLRYLLRTSDVQSVSSEMSAIVNDPVSNPIFESNEDNAIYYYSGLVPNISQVVEPGGGRGFGYYLLIPTTHFINTMAKNNDPRLDFFISPRDCDPADPDCVQDNLQGVPPGLSVGNIGSPEDYSRRSVEMFESATIINGIFMTYSELNFILAEAKERGLITSDASPEEYYNTAVTASFDQWGVEMPEDFLTTEVPYDNSTERLYEQKWLALFYSGVEAWFDWKRTKKPSFIQAGPGTINDGQVPVRLRYPALEQSVNAANYNAASQAMGGDDINASSWWW